VIQSHSSSPPPPPSSSPPSAAAVACATCRICAAPASEALGSPRQSQIYVPAFGVQGSISQVRTRSSVGGYEWRLERPRLVQKRFTVLILSIFDTCSFQSIQLRPLGRCSSTMSHSSSSGVEAAGCFGSMKSSSTTPALGSCREHGVKETPRCEHATAHHTATV
jgi:hypothetical protein